MIKLPLLKYKRTPHPRFPSLYALKVEFARIEVEKSFLGYVYSTKQYEVYKDSVYWKYKDTGDFLEDDLEQMLKARITYYDLDR